MDESPLDLENLVVEAESAVTNAADLAALDELRVRYLGKSGLLTSQLKKLGSLPKEARPRAGQAINKAKQSLQKGQNMANICGSVTSWTSWLPKIRTGRSPAAIKISSGT